MQKDKMTGRGERGREGVKEGGRERWFSMSVWEVIT